MKKQEILPNKLSVNVLKKLITSSDDEFEKIKDLYSINTGGIYRFSKDQIFERFGVHAIFIGEKKITVIHFTEVEGKIEFESDEIRGLIIINSRISDFVAKDLTIIDSIEIFGSKTGSFILSKSRIKDVFIENSEIQNLYISNSCSVGDFHIQKSKIGDFIISKNCCLGNFLIQDNSSLLSFYIGDSSVIGNFNVRTKSEVEELRLSKDSLIGDILFEKECKIGDVIIEKGSFSGDFSFSDCTIRKFHAEDILSNFKVVGSNIGNFFLKNCLIPEFQIKQSSKIEASIVGGSINNLEFVDTSISKEAVISFSNTKIFKVKMENFAQLGNLFFRKIESLENSFEWIDINERYPKLISENLNHVDDKKNAFIEFTKRKYLENVKEKVALSVFTISQSSLGKTEFSDCDLAGFNFEFNNSKIIDCFITGGTLPGEKSNKEKGDGICVFGEKKGSEKWHEQRASFFSQLKSIFQTQGNISRATFFHSKWAEEQRAVYRKKWFSGEGFSLWLGGISSNHGESWVRATLFLIFAPLIFYFGYLCSIDKLSADLDTFYYYFEFLNPVHKIDFTGKINSSAIPFDIIGRIVSSYGIYQFILSFRKFSRK